MIHLKILYYQKRKNIVNKGEIIMLNIQTKEQFDNIVEKIEKNVLKYERFLNDIRYKLFLSNGEVLNIEYPESCIPHILGINLEYIKMLGIYKEKSSYELMKEFLNDSYSAYKKVNDLNKLFSNYVDIKNNNFNDILKINLSDIKLIIEYKKDRIYGHDVLESPCEYYILTQKNGKLLLLGLIKQNGKYVPQTSQEIDLKNEKDEQNLKNILFKQHIMFCNTLFYNSNIEEPMKKVFLNEQEKSDRLLYLKSTANKHSSVVRVERDYECAISKLIESKSNMNNYKGIIQDITSAITRNEIIDISNFDTQLDGEIYELVNAYNDSKFSANHEKKYSELKSEYEKLKEEVELLKKYNEELQKSDQEKDVEIVKLKQENVEYRQNEDKILELLKH